MTDKPPTAEGSASPQARSDLMTPTAAATALADLSNMLESATTLFAVNTIQQKAEALRRVLQVTHADALWQNRFCAQRLKSMLRMGEISSPRRTCTKAADRVPKNPLPRGRGKLADHRITYRLSSECQTIAKMPRERLDGYIARAEQTHEDGNVVEISKAGLLAEAAMPESEAEIASTEKQSAAIIPLRKTSEQVKEAFATVKERIAADKACRDAPPRKRAKKNAKEPETEYWLSRGDDEVLQRLIDDYSNFHDDMVKFATPFVKLDKRGDMCCALLDTFCEDQDDMGPPTRRSGRSSDWKRASRNWRHASPNCQMTHPIWRYSPIRLSATSEKGCTSTTPLPTGLRSKPGSATTPPPASGIDGFCLRVASTPPKTRGAKSSDFRTIPSFAKPPSRKPRPKPRRINPHKNQ